MFILVAIVLVLFPREATLGALEGLNFAQEKVIVSILPFAIVSSAMVFSHTAQRVGVLFAPLFKRAHLNPYGAIAFMSSLLGGYPTGCKNVCDMCREGYIDKPDAEKMLCYVNNGGIIFAINIVGIEGFGSIYPGVFVFCVSALSAFITSQIFARVKIAPEIKISKEKPPFWGAAGRGIASGGSVIVNIMSAFIVFYAIGNALGLYRFPLLYGIWEMTKGVLYAGSIKNLPLAAFFFSLGGVSVWAQSAAVAAECDVSIQNMITGKITSAIIAFLITYVFTAFAGGIWEVGALALIAIVVIAAGFKALKKLYANA